MLQQANQGEMIPKVGIRQCRTGIQVHNPGSPILPHRTAICQKNTPTIPYF